MTQTKQSPSPPATLQLLADRLTRLQSPGVIGMFDHVDLVEIIGMRRGKDPVNLLSIAAFGEDGAGQSFSEPAPLTERLKLEGFKDWTFGVCRARRPCSAVVDALEQLERTGFWGASGKPLAVGRLEPQEPLFVPPDGTVRVPVNRILKNNAWNGSHLLRLLDVEKQPFEPFFADPRRLQRLSEMIAPAVPLALSGLSDFLGDVLIQLPVTAVVADIRAPSDEEHVRAHVIWHPAIPERDLQLAARMRSDEALSGAAVSSLFRTTTTLPLRGHVDAVEAELWDAGTGVLLAATASTSTVKTIVLNIHVNELEPRIFTAPDEAGARATRRVSLAHDAGDTVIGAEQPPSAQL